MSGVSLRAAARRAGVTSGAPYRHVQDKAEQLTAAAGEGFRCSGSPRWSARVKASSGAGATSMSWSRGRAR
ncbi:MULTISPECIES: hypothetical protein [Sorangium]|uniref:hypothetical protein n=1 Tax=Sorangium TaxID=39643 RepID=UPI003D9C117D